MTLGVSTRMNQVAPVKLNLMESAFHAQDRPQSNTIKVGNIQRHTTQLDLSFWSDPRPSAAAQEIHPR